MKICFSGLVFPVEVDASAVTVLEVHNRTLFTRICSSLYSGMGREAVEPYTLWNAADEELKPGAQVLFVETPLKFPWEDKSLSGVLAKRMESLLFEDEYVRREVEDAFEELSSRVLQLALQLDADYSFGVDWDLKRYLKSFGFGVDIAHDETLFDKLIEFLLLAKDASLNKPIAFVNLKLFLSENELLSFYEQAFFSNLSILLIENTPDAVCRSGERKYIIDQDFLEDCIILPADLPVPPQ